MQRYEFSKSSNIRAATLGDDGTVEVEFKKGAPRRYASFTAEQFADWCSAASPGGWFYANVRKDPKGHPEISPPGESIEPASVEEQTTGDAPADGWCDLQPNSADPDEGRVVSESRVDGVVAQVLAPEPKRYKSALARARASFKRG